MAHHAPAAEPDRDAVAFRGYLAQFAGPDELVHGADAARMAGRTNLDAYVPFPVHGLDDALGVRPTRLPWLVFCMGVTGGLGILLFQFWTNGVDYPWIISGKPLLSVPANIPVTFEVTVLFSAFTTFLAMLAINGLPRLYQPLMQTSVFNGVTTDKFLLYLPATASETTASREWEDRLRGWGATSVEPFYAPVYEGALPTKLKLTLICLVSLLSIPPFFVWGMRGMTSEQPRLHVIFDMDDQPKYKAQQTSAFFADARAMRPQVAGTVEWSEDVAAIEYERGLDSARIDETMISVLFQPEPAADGAAPAEETQPPVEGTAPGAESAAPGAEGAAPAAGEAPAEPQLPWIENFPSSLVIDDALMARGQARYNIYCGVCHGLGGDGNGLVAQRAIELQQATWVPPTNLHSEAVVKQPVGQIFNTITNGVRKMPGYAAQIPPQDRWAIVLYVRALQRSRMATLQDVPENLRGDLKELAPVPVGAGEGEFSGDGREPAPDAPGSPAAPEATAPASGDATGADDAP